MIAAVAEKYSYCCYRIGIYEKNSSTKTFILIYLKDRNDCCHHTGTTLQMSILVFAA